MIQYTDQEAFNKAYIEVTKQGRPSSCLGQCLYRHPDGLKCAVGHLVSTQELRNLACRKGIQLEHLSALTIADAIGVNGNLLQCIQRCHDRPALQSGARMLRYFVPIFQKRMKEVAEEYDLTVPEV